MRKKSFICIALSISFMITGCSNDNSKDHGENNVQSTSSVNEAHPNEYKDLTSLPKEYTLEIAKENGDVCWTLDVVYNVEKFNDFMSNIKNEKEDNIRITSVTKEGEAIIKDLDYNGEVITLTIDSTRDEYSQNPRIDSYEYGEMVIEESYDEDHGGTFIEYYLKGEEDKLAYILQIFKKD